MPYLEKSRRRALLTKLISLDKAGDINYLGTLALMEWDQADGLNPYRKLYNLGIDLIELRGKSYQHYNDVIGAYTCCKLEYIRRYPSAEVEQLMDRLISDFYTNEVAPYEDKKIKENGDVYL